MTELITKQNNYIHHTITISAVNTRHGNNRLEDDGMTLVER